MFHSSDLPLSLRTVEDESVGRQRSDYHRIAPVWCYQKKKKHMNKMRVAEMKVFTRQISEDTTETYEKGHI